VYENKKILEISSNCRHNKHVYYELISYCLFSKPCVKLGLLWWNEEMKWENKYWEETVDGSSVCKTSKPYGNCQEISSFL
jgi:hypothetical protein